MIINFQFVAITSSNEVISNANKTNSMNHATMFIKHLLYLLFRFCVPNPKRLVRTPRNQHTTISTIIQI